MEIARENFQECVWHESFYQGADMKSILEFNLPSDAKNFYDASNGHNYRSLVEEMARRLEGWAGEAQGTQEGSAYVRALTELREMAIDLDVKIYRP